MLSSTYYAGIIGRGLRAGPIILKPSIQLDIIIIVCDFIPLASHAYAYLRAYKKWQLNAIAIGCSHDQCKA